MVETPYVFRPRTAGESKLSPLVGLDFLGLVVHHATGGVLPTRFVLFALIGGVGLIVHLAVLTLLIDGGDATDFTASQTAATIAAMASNFVLNNEITYRNRRYSGFGIVGGFLMFALLCGVGAIANINVANVLYHSHRGWDRSRGDRRADRPGLELRRQQHFRLAQSAQELDPGHRPGPRPHGAGHAAGRLRLAPRHVLAAVPRRDGRSRSR